MSYFTILFLFSLILVTESFSCYFGNNKRLSIWTKCGIFLGEGSVYESQPCKNGTSWCLKFINADNDQSYRQCDNDNEFCNGYGDKCGGIKAQDITSLPYAHLMCCCPGDNCNSSNSFEILFIFKTMVLAKFLIN